MSRINTNIPSMVATRILGANNRSLNLSLDRLSTGLKINTGKDDPAGLIASEALRAEKMAIGSAITNISRANNVVATAEGGLDEINKLLTELEELVDRSANEDGISDDERDANQLQIDSILDSINRIAASTSFQGKKLISGEFDYTTSGVSTTNFADVAINSARIANGGNRAVVVDVSTSAQFASLTYAASATPAGTTTIEVAGKLGTEVISLTSGVGVATVVTAVNQSKELTGVSASVNGSGQLVFASTEYGSDQFVSVEALQGTFTVTGGDAGSTKDFGRDAIVTINGVSAITDGLTAKLQTSTLAIELTMSTAFGANIGSDTFHVTGGGATFAIAPELTLNSIASLGIRNVSTSSLGKGTVGFLSSIGSGQTNDLKSGNFSNAQRIIRAAQSDVSSLRGRLGAFQKDTLATASNALSITQENTTAAESSIRDTDFASETSALTRAQILAQSATNVLRLANQQPQQILSLLG